MAFKTTIVIRNGQAKGYCLCGYQTKKGDQARVEEKLESHRKAVHGGR